MRRLAVLAIVVLSVFGHAAEPPLPNVAQPVDYAQWLNQEFGRDDRDNAAADYRAACAAIQADESLDPLAVKRAGEWTADERSRAEAYVKAQERALSLYAAAARRQALGLKFGAELLEDPQWLELLTALRPLGRAAVIRARVRIVQVDLAGASQDIVTLLRTGLHLQSQPAAVPFLYGVTYSSLGLHVLGDYAVHARTAADLNRALTLLEEHDPGSPRPLAALLAETVNSWNLLQRGLRDPDDQGRYQVFVGTGALAGKRFPLVPPQALETLTRQISAQFERGQALFVADYAVARQRAAEFARESTTREGEFVSIFVPDCVMMAIAQRKYIALRHGVRCNLALRAYHAQHGKWPTSLEAALGEKRAKFALDAFSNKPLVYRLDDAGEPVLYTVSLNAKDDGGEIYRTDGGEKAFGDAGDFSFWPQP